MSKPTVFISYSHKDKEWKNRLVSHLSVLGKDGQLQLWEDTLIGAGEDWLEKIQEAMDKAAVAILLVSSNSLTSDFILREEVTRLLDRKRAEGLRIFPVIVKSCAWQKIDWLKQMQVRPREGKPLSAFTGNKRDEQLTMIVDEVHKIIQTAAQQSDPGGPVPPHPDDISIGRLPVTGQFLFGRDEELKLLDECWADRNINVISLVAWGGVGKSTLVNHWLRRMSADNYRGAEKIYAWSFYSQGTTDRAVSADLFIDSALRWFGDTDSTKGSPWDKGERLAKLVRQHRALLLLDGLEPLQYPPGFDEGKLKDQALQALLRELAANNSGLCVISTRLPVRDLDNFLGSTARHHDLEHLAPEAGAELLRAMGVKGGEAELEQASKEFGGHSLALALLGSYLTDVFQGDIRRRNEVGRLEEDTRHGGHARRVMASYEKWFGEGPEIAVLRMLGLFNRPADKDAIVALRAAPAIAGLTDALQSLSEREWQQLLGKLRRAKLLAGSGSGQPDTLDTHPLVREHFGQQLKQENPEAWREGNYRLYEHLKSTTKEFPDTIEEMTPLFAAVIYGCQAGCYQQTLEDIFFKRMDRGVTFVVKNFGAIGTVLSALSGFFKQPWQQVVIEINDEDKGYILNAAGYCLQALGRLEEAAQPMQAALMFALSQEQWINAARAAVNLSEFYLVIGDLPHAIAYAEKSILLADQSGNSLERMSTRTMMARVLHTIGRISEAEALFQESERMQQERQPQSLFLYSVWGFRYCDLLLNLDRHQEVVNRSKVALQIVLNGSKNLLDIALNHLSLGRAYLLESQREASNNFTQETEHLKRAVDNLRQAGTLEYLARGLLARAELYRMTGDFKRTKTDIDETMSIATRSGMKLYEADCYLEYARFYLAQGDKGRAREHVAKSKEMIEEMGYHRRDKDVREIERQIEGGEGNH